MSKFNKTLLSAAVLTALFAGGNASAFDATYNAAENAVDAPQSIAGQLSPGPVALTSALRSFAQLGDNFIGRSTGFQIRVTLPAGYSWSTGGATFTAGAALPGAAPNNWSGNISPASNGSRFLVYSVQPNGTASPIISGELAAITGLQIGGTFPTSGSLTATYEIVDANSSQVIATHPVTIATFTDGVAVTCVETDNTDPAYAKIDVKPNGDDAKTDFVLGSPWTLGTGAATTAELGEATFTASGGVTFVAGTAFAVNVTTQSQAGIVSFTAHDGANCAAPILATDTTATAGVYNLSFTGAGFAALNPATNLVTVCVNVNGTTELSAQSITATTAVNSVSEGACPVADLNYNGSVAKVFFFNPASNQTQQSFVRVTNDGTVDGLVTIDARDDAGVEAGPISFNLLAGESAWLSATDLETGTDDRFTLTGSLGAPTEGKRMLEITGEFDGMLVSSFVRNNTDGTLTNVTDVDNGTEQDDEEKAGQPINP